MKKKIYIGLFIFLGLLLQFLIHAIIEISYIVLLRANFEKYSFGFSWEQLYLIHHIGTIVLIFCGVLFGLWQGKFWWHKVCEKKKLLK
jgi:hypothetical protein